MSRTLARWRATLALAAVAACVACSGPVQCGPCPGADQRNVPLRARFDAPVEDGRTVRVCAGDKGCWTATLLAPDPAAYDRHGTDWLCRVEDAAPGDATCDPTWEATRRGAPPDGLSVRLWGPPEPYRSVEVSAESRVGDRLLRGAVEVEYVEGRGTCSCGDRASALVRLG